MKESTKTKKALRGSLFALFACIVLLIGTTFAWFTDTASTGVNKIQAGNLKVGLEKLGSDGKWVDATQGDLEFVKAEGHETEAILWEPGCTYALPELRVVNKGNLALKYKIQISGINGDAELNDVIDWTINGEPIDLTEQHLKANEEGAGFTIKGHMQESAGNEYQDKSIDGVRITVVATQDTVESDSIDNKYDNNAQYAVSVRDQDGLDKALASDGATKITIEKGANVTITDKTYVGKNPGTTIENRGTLSVSEATIYSTDTAAQGRAAITNYGTLTVNNSTIGSTQSRGNAIRNYGTATIKDSTLTCCDNYLNGGYAYVFASSNGTMTVANCKYEGGANGVFAADGGEIIIDSGSYKLTGDKSYHMFYMENGKITVNGGTFEKSGNTRDFAKLDGTGTLADHLTINDGTFTFNGAAWTLN